MHLGASKDAMSLSSWFLPSFLLATAGTHQLLVQVVHGHSSGGQPGAGSPIILHVSTVGETSKLPERPGIPGATGGLCIQTRRGLVSRDGGSLACFTIRWKHTTFSMNLSMYSSEYHPIAWEYGGIGVVRGGGSPVRGDHRPLCHPVTPDTCGASVELFTAAYW